MMMKKMYLKPAVEVEVMTEGFEILAGSVSEVTSIDSNLDDDDDFNWGGAGHDGPR